MIELRLGDQVALYDAEATAAAYAAVECGFGDRCGCDPCRNFAAQRTTIYPPNFLALLHRLGIDPLKEGEAFYYGEVSPGVHFYGGWFYFIGRLVAAGEYRVEENGFSYWIPSLNVFRTFLYSPPPEARLLFQQIQVFTENRSVPG